MSTLRLYTSKKALCSILGHIAITCCLQISAITNLTISWKMYFSLFTLFNFVKMIALIKYEPSLKDCNYLISRMSSPYYYRHNHQRVMSSSCLDY